ncbi:MAG: acyl-CoA thioesterase [Deltaproteobacteria bacterium]|nr:acyl-CoA thioesterase [Deltaproteobacteria bacterium]
MAAPALPPADAFRFSCEIEVRFRDLDAMGHVNNAAYLTYFEIARTGYMRELGHAAEDERELGVMFPFIVAEITCRYLAPAGLGERLRVLLRTVRIGSKSFEFDYLVVRAGDGQAVATGHSVQIYYDYRERRSLPVPQRFRELIAKLENPVP